MESFGVYLMLVAFFRWLKELLSTHEGNVRRKKMAIKNGQDYYIDDNMNRVRISDGLIYREGKINGDYCQYNPRNGQIIKNISKERLAVVSAQNKRSAIQKGMSRYIYDDRENACCYPDGFAGAHWIDMNTGQIYVRRSYRGTILWLNVSSGFYEGFAEGENRLWKPDKELRRLNDEISKSKYVYNMTKKGHHGDVYLVHEDSRRRQDDN